MRFAFLASTLGDDSLTAMRLAVHDKNAGNPRKIWVAERDWPHLRQDAGIPPLEIVDICLDAIRESERLLLVVDGSVGTRLTHRHGELASSYLEMEVFQAAISRIPIHVFVIGDVAVGSPAGRLLALVGEAVARADWQPCASARDAGTHIERLRESRRWLRGRPRGPASDAAQLVAAFAMRRFNDWSNERLGEEMEWLDGQYEAAAAPDPAVIASLLNDPAKPRPRMKTQNDLARAWLALRLLMAVPYNGPPREDFDPLWNRALGQWASAAAWYGLHAHMQLGHVAALGSLLKVRRKLAETGGRDPATRHTASVNGALASCYYSLAGKSARGAPSGASPYATFMRRAALYVERGFAAEPKNLHAGLWSLKGSIDLRQGDAAAAISAYKAACDLTAAQGKGSAQYGECLSELGWAEFQAGRGGIGNLEQGLALLVGHPDPGFEVRARVKLARALLMRRPLRTVRELAIAHQLAIDHQLDDQIRRGMASATSLNRALARIGLGADMPVATPVDRGSG